MQNFGGVTYRIVVPSRARVDNMVQLFSLVPDAYVTVDEREIDDYRAAVPDGRLMPHPPLSTLGAIRQWILDNTPETCVVMLDDDFAGVIALIGRHTRSIKEPAAILKLFENQMQMCVDLGLSLFGFQREPNPMWLNGGNPFSLTAPAYAAIGVVGRKLKYDVSLSQREDLDLTMQALLKERVVLIDRRYYFDFGPVWSGRGGQQGMRTSEREIAETKKMKQRWGEYVQIETANKNGTTGSSIRVPRRQRIVSAGGNDD